jgi:hypothetical protein
MKRIITTILVSLVAACGVEMNEPATSTDSADLTANDVEHYYFSDATFTTEVGFVEIPCSGGKISRGHTSRYYAISSTACNVGGSHLTCYEWPDGGDQNQVPCPVDIYDYLVD